MEKVLTKATNFLKYCTGSADGMDFAVGTSRVGCAAGRVYTRLGEGASGSGLFMAWVVDFWGFSISSFPLPSSVSIGEVSFFFSHGQKVAQIYEDSDSPCCCQCSSTMVSLKHSPSGFSSSK